VADRAPAFYARRSDWWTVLHPPYTVWHLSYVVIGACLAPHVDVVRLLASVVAFLLAVGVAAHVFDELHGRPLGTAIPDRVLTTVGIVSLAGAVALGVAGVDRVGLVLVPFIVVGPVLVLAYDLELLGGRLHTDVGFALAWGAFPVLTAYVAQADRVRVEAVLAAAAAFGLSWAQRALSTPARLVRRRARSVEGRVVLDDGTTQPVDAAFLIRPLERALRAMSWSMAALAAALAVARLT